MNFAVPPANPASAAEGIRRLGFRRWYERELIEGHAWLVTGFLSLIVVAVCLEQIDWRRPVQEAASILYIVAGVLLCLFSLRRYSRILIRAECLGGQSTCAQCSTYGVLQVLDAGAPADAEHSAEMGWLRVSCRRCGHQWRIEHDNTIRS